SRFAVTRGRTVAGGVLSLGVPATADADRRRPGHMWGPAYLNQPATLRLYMTQLRRKLEPEPERPRYLLTEPGMGYRFSPTA
ncbi:MAG TPA: winged helix-turn-helix domain-containing protein, partial [Propioniciclava tarda]|nr:winged helix-turn-helix domain-containing protein [Propioniciclava tarda]